MGGRLMLDSRPGVGTTFRIIIPRAPRGQIADSDISTNGPGQWPIRTMSSS